MQLLTVLFLTFSTWLQGSLDMIRTDFEKAEGSEEHAASLYDHLKDYDDADPLLIAYKGAAFVMQAHHASKLSEKKELFVAGAKDIEAAIEADPDHVEIRLIRLIIQENTPRILRYKKNIDEDKQMILDNFHRQPTAVQEQIKRYTSQRSKAFTEAELEQLSD